MLSMVQVIGVNTDSSRSLWIRMVRAAKLQADLYDEVKDDPSATIQAFKAVLIASAATGIGSGVSIVIKDGFAWLTWGLVLGVVIAVSTWILWSFITYFVGARFFRVPDTSTTFKEVLRTVGFSNSSSTIGLLSCIPLLGWIVLPAIFIWTTIAAIIAVRQVMSFSTWRAVFTCFASWVVYVVVLITPVAMLFSMGKMS